MWEDSRRLPGGLGFVVWLPPGHPHLPPHLRLRGRFLHSSRFLSHAEVASFGLAPRAQQVGQLEIAARLLTVDANAASVSRPRPGESSSPPVTFTSSAAPALRRRRTPSCFDAARVFVVSRPGASGEKRLISSTAVRRR